MTMHRRMRAALLLGGMILMTSGVMTMVLGGPAANAAGGAKTAWYCNTTTSEGQPCIPTTTQPSTTTTEQVTTTSAQPTTTSVAPSTTVVSAIVTQPEVLGVQPAVLGVQPAVLGVQPTVLGVSANAALPNTGSSTKPLTVLGGVLILLGALAMAASKIKRREV